MTFKCKMKRKPSGRANIAKIRHDNQKKNPKTHLVQAFKIVGTVLCYLGCVLNSMKILSNLFKQSKVVSTNIKTYPSLFLPSLTVCNATAFKETIDDFQDLELDNFLDNTLNLDEILEDLSFEASYKEDIDDFEIHNLTDIFNSSSSLSISQIYSFLKGRCYTFDINRKVPKLRWKN